MSAEPAHERSAWWFRGSVLLLVVIGLISTLNRQTGEVAVYTRAAERALAGEEVYVVEAKAFTYPPAQVLPHIPLVVWPESAQPVLFYFLNVALLLAVLWMLRRIVREEFAEKDRDGPGWIFWGIVFAICGRHLTSPLENQSNDLPILFLMMLTAFARGRNRAHSGAMAAAMAAALKATPLLYAPILVWQKRFGAALTFALTLVGLTLLPDLLFPRGDGMLWMSAWFQTFVSKVGIAEAPAAEGAWAAWNPLNQSLSGTLYRLSVDPGESRWTWNVSVWSPAATGLKAATLAAQVIVLLLIGLAVGPPSAGAVDAPDRRMRRLGEVGAVVCGMLLLSPMSSKAHFCVLIVPVVYALVHLWTRGRDTLVITCLAIALFLGSLTSKGIIGVDLGNAFLARGSVTWCALVLLLGTLRVAWMRRRADAAPVAATA